MKTRDYRKKDAPEIKRMMESLIKYADDILPKNLKKFEELDNLDDVLKHYFTRGINKPEWKTYVCEQNSGKITGFITGGVDKKLPGCRISKYGSIEIFYVDEGYRGKGAGKMLLGKMREWLKKKGCDAIRVDTWITNSAARAVYKKMGFKEIAVMFVKEIGEEKS
jgi:GNAT superfamily N-acetyltransferase